MNAPNAPPLTLEEDLAQLEAGTKAATRAADNLIAWEHTFLSALEGDPKADFEWECAPADVQAKIWALYTPKQ